MAKPRTLRKTSRSDEVAQLLMDAIAAGEFEAGGRLPSENALAEEYGVSRSTLREAFKKLEQMGAIYTMHGSGSYVRARSEAAPGEEPRLERAGRVVSETFSLDRFSVTEYLDARLAIERTAISLAIDRMDDADFLTLKRILDQSEQEGCSVEEYIELDCKFHRELVRASKNEFLCLFWSHLEPCLREQQRRVVVIPGLVEGSKNKHHQLYDALLQRNKKEALAAYEAHTSTILGRFFTLASESYSSEGQKQE
ncbi:FadR/GntR family transcriptional regulator [Allofournierella sp.]|uniref:FadR/GntR family transcriptional regulator n=1 Tax=Allofournierella sp. TaxID=1940256 RepID=UPI003AEFAA6D